MSEHKSSNQLDEQLEIEELNVDQIETEEPDFSEPEKPKKEEKAKDFKGSLFKLIKFLRPYLPVLIIAIVLAILASVLEVVGPKIMGQATDKIVSGALGLAAGTGTMDFVGILHILIWIAAIYLISAIFSYVMNFIVNEVANKASYKLRKEISEKINLLPLSYFDKVNNGEILSTITNDVGTITQTLISTLPQFFTSSVMLVGALIMMISISGLMTLVAILVLPLSLVAVLLITKRSQPLFKEQQNTLGKANGEVEEMYSMHTIVKAFNQEQKCDNNFDELNERLETTAWKSQFLGGMMMPIMTFVGNLGYVIVCILGGVLTIKGRITIGQIQAFIQYMQNFTGPVSQLAGISNSLQQTAAASERVFNFLSAKNEIPDTKHPVDHQDVLGNVSFDQVRFGYHPDKMIIHQFSENVQRGQKIAIVGPTGAGKSTIVKLLMRFYDVNSGAILVDEYNVKEYTRNGLRRMFGMVLQDTWLYSDTIRENIRYGKLDATDEEVVQAAKSAQADHFIRTLPDGYDTMINEDASNISQGEKQLLTIARTVLSNPSILILDEATSNVDTQTEISIQTAMDILMRGKTSFVIAHRLSTIKNADTILVMQDGDIVESGNHEELLAAGGAYEKLYNSQFQNVE